jgi:hypothetical protein
MEKMNNKFFEMRMKLLDDKYANIVKNVEGQPETLEMNEEKESLLAEIQELKQEIEQDIENLKNNKEEFNLFLSVRQEFEINKKMALLQNKINKFLE